MTSGLPTLAYPLTRNFKWPWFGAISLLGAALVIILLAAINIPLTGYETVISFQNNFNATDFHWFHRVMPFRILRPGSLCDPHIFKVGDTFVTNYSFFEWKIDSVVEANAGDSAISYKGVPLTCCDVTSIYVNGNIHSWSADFTIIMTCKDDMFNVTARTSFSMGLLPGQSPLLGMVNDGTKDIRGDILNYIIRTASMDVGGRTYNAFVRSNYTAPTMISLRSDFVFCPMTLGIDAPCSTSPPKFVITQASAVHMNASYLLFDNSYPTDPINYVLDADSEQPFYNLLQAVYGAIRVDLGNPSVNNFILNPSALNGTIVEKFPITAYNQDLVSTTSALYYSWHNPNPSLQKVLPVSVSGPAQIQLVYPCRFQQRKPLGSLIVAVLVATISMFSGAWSVFIFTATAFAKRTDPLTNQCDGHSSRHSMPLRAPFDVYELKPRGSEDSQGPPPKDFIYSPLIK